jgi:hypothetical protein
MLFDYDLLIRDFRPNEIIVMTVHVVITVALEMVLRDFGPYGIIFLIKFFHYFRLSSHSWLSVYE